MAFVAVSLMGCFPEDDDGCRKAVYLRLSYTLNRHETDKFSEQVNNLNILVYNEDGTFRESHSIGCGKLDANNRYKLDLEPGKYKIVVWGNCTDDSFLLTEGPSYTQMRMHLKAEADNSVSQCSSLFHGFADIDVAQDGEHHIEMIKNTNLIRVVIEDLGNTRAAGNTRVCPDTHFSVRISGNNGIYTYDNQLTNECATQPLTYLPAYGRTEAQDVKAEFTVLRMFCDRSDMLNLTLRDTRFPDSEPIHDLWLTEKILSTIPEVNTDRDLDKYDEYEIRFQVRFNGTWSVVKIYINDWELTESSGGI